MYTIYIIIYVFIYIIYLYIPVDLAIIDCDCKFPFWSNFNKVPIGSVACFVVIIKLLLNSQIALIASPRKPNDWIDVKSLNSCNLDV